MTHEQPQDGRQDVLVLLGRLHVSRNAVLFLGSLVLGGLLLAMSAHYVGLTKDVLLAVGTSVIAAAIFGAFQVMVTGRVLEDLLTAAVADSTRTAVTQVLALDANERERYVPLQTFPASNSPDPDFNKAVTSSLSESSTYTFRGFTGLYAAVRISLLAHRLDEAHIIVVDPGNSEALGIRANHEVAIHLERTYSEVVDDLRTDIYRTVIGARHAAARCTRLSLHFVQEPQMNRVELMHDRVFYSLFSDSTSGAKFPNTLIFSSRSVTYEVCSNEAQLVRHYGSTKSFQISPRTTDHELKAIVRDLGGPECTDAEWEQLTNGYLEFSSGFKSRLAIH